MGTKMNHLRLVPKEDKNTMNVTVLEDRTKMALALAVSLDNDTVFSMLVGVEKMLQKSLPDFHHNSMLIWRQVLRTELAERGITTA